MKRQEGQVELLPVAEAEVWLYCENCYSAPHRFVLRLLTSWDDGIDETTSSQGLSVICGHCGRVEAAYGTVR